jgi:hypothetical protein
MSDLPASGPGPVVAPGASVVPTIPGWSQRLGSVLLIIFCLELGLFLLIYPWTDAWSENYFAWLVRGRVQLSWHSFWDNSYVRGGVSGMGAVNLWIAVTEVFRLFSRGSSNRKPS